MEYLRTYAEEVRGRNFTEKISPRNLRTTGISYYYMAGASIYDICSVSGKNGSYIYIIYYNFLGHVPSRSTIIRNYVMVNITTKLALVMRLIEEISDIRFSEANR